MGVKRKKAKKARPTAAQRRQADAQLKARLNRWFDETSETRHGMHVARTEDAEACEGKKKKCGGGGSGTG